MPINVSCQQCGKGYAVPDERAGQRFKCRECGTVVSVPVDKWGYGSGNSGFAGHAEGSSDNNNPYAAPHEFATGRQTEGRAEAMTRTNICAIFLYVVGGLSVLNHLYSIVATLLGKNLNPFVADNGPPVDESERLIILVVGVGVGFLCVVLDSLVILGAHNLQRLKSYPLAMTGAIIACIPCCGPCLVFGIPFGIWALVLLNDSSIKRHFGTG
jgi:hypothetical protein